LENNEKYRSKETKNTELIEELFVSIRYFYKGVVEIILINKMAQKKNSFSIRRYHA